MAILLLAVVLGCRSCYCCCILEEELPGLDPVHSWALLVVDAYHGRRHSIPVAVVPAYHLLVGHSHRLWVRRKDLLVGLPCLDKDLLFQVQVALVVGHSTSSCRLASGELGFRTGRQAADAPKDRAVVAYHLSHCRRC